jgi:amino acid transporter
MAGDAELVNESRQLRKAVGAVGFFSLAFGCIVGSGWVIVLGDWLGRGGPGGAIVGFLAGGAALVLVGFCYAELAARMPRAGGEFLYACEGLGRDAGFFVAWFLTLYMIAVAAFEGIALSVMLRQLFDALRGVSGYELLGQRVTYVGVGVGLIGAAGICILNVLGARIAVGFQSIVTFTFIGILLMVVTIAFVNGSPRNWAPVFPNTSEVSWWQGALWVFSISGMFLNGFQAGLYAIEERREKTSLRRSVLSVVAAIAAAAAFYSLLVLASTSAVPWPQLVRADLPAATAFAASVPGGILGHRRYCRCSDLSYQDLERRRTYGVAVNLCSGKTGLPTNTIRESFEEVRRAISSDHNCHNPDDDCNSTGSWCCSSHSQHVLNMPRVELCALSGNSSSTP